MLLLCNFFGMFIVSFDQNVQFLYEDQILSVRSNHISSYHTEKGVDPVKGDQEYLINLQNRKKLQLFYV